MATTVHSTTSTPADLRRATRIFAAFIVPLGPALVAVLRYVLPYQTNDEASAAVRAVAADPDRQSLVVWLGFFAMLTLLPGVLFVARVARRNAPRLTAAALLLLVPGYTAFGLLVAGDAATWYGVTHDLPESAVIDLYNGGHPMILVSTGVFVVGHVLGTVLLGIACSEAASCRPRPPGWSSSRSRCTSSPPSSWDRTTSTWSPGGPTRSDSLPCRSRSSK